MKSLFIIIVIIASLYLVFQQKGFEKISHFFPQQQIENEAQVLLTAVNKTVTSNVNKELTLQLTKFKEELTAQKNARIDDLARQVSTLEQKLDEQQIMQQPLLTSEVDNLVVKSSVVESSTVNSSPIVNSVTSFPIEAEFAKMQFAGGEPLSAAQINKQQTIKRQASLQDIAERMNKTSLHALTQ